MIPPAFRKDVDALPPLIRQLLDAELAVGNELISVSHTFPAPPVGVALVLARPIPTRRRASGDGFRFREGNNSQYNGSFTDSDGKLEQHWSEPRR